MYKVDQSGALNALLIPLIVAIIFFLSAAGFGVWAYTSRQDYKNNTNQKIASATAIAKKQAETAKDVEFTEKEKLPFKTYNGPAAYGSISIQYPKTWSAQVTEAQSAGDSLPINGYWQPNFVPALVDTTSFALRVEVVQTTYDEELKQFDGLVQGGKVTVSPFKALKVPGTVGVKIDGAILTNKNGSMVLLPLRDKTLKIWTESTQYLGDFNNNILPNLTFIP